LCEYCEKAIVFKKKIAKVMSDENLEYQENFEIKILQRLLVDKSSIGV